MLFSSSILGAYCKSKDDAGRGSSLHKTLDFTVLEVGRRPSWHEPLVEGLTRLDWQSHAVEATRGLSTYGSS